MVKTPFQKRKGYPFVAPLLMGIYPVLSLLAANITEIPFSEGVRALLVSFLCTGIILFILATVLRNREKAAILTSLVVLVFFAYGHIYLFLEGGGLFGLPLGRHRYLVPLNLVVILGAGWSLRYTKRSLTGVVQTITLIAALLVIFPIVQMGYTGIRTYTTSRAGNHPASLALPSPDGETPPDIYYIILDGYPRADILHSTFGFDNHEFLNFLTAKGFYVAPCSQSNYSITMPSLASSLNMKYIHVESGKGIRLSESYRLEELIQGSAVQTFVEAAGYTTVNFETGYKWLRWPSADYYFSAFENSSSQSMFQTGLNEFELLLVKTSAGLIFFDMQVTSSENQPVDLYALLEVSPRRIHQERLYFNLKTLMQVPDTIPSPKFVYAHFTSPHPPLIFDAEGNFLLNEPSGKNELAGYRDQIIYLNTRIMEVVTALLARSEQPPIILIQGDHGAVIEYAERKIDKNEKLAILSAYYLPRMDYSLLYPNITPVNSFRLVFDRYLNGDFELLPDHSYFNVEPVELPCSE